MKVLLDRIFAILVQNALNTTLTIIISGDLMKSKDTITVVINMIFNKWNNAPFYSKPFLNLKNCLKISSNVSVSIQSFYLGLYISKHLLTIIHRKLFSGLCQLS